MYIIISYFQEKIKCYNAFFIGISQIITALLHQNFFIIDQRIKYTPVRDKIKNRHLGKDEICVLNPIN